MMVTIHQGNQKVSNNDDTFNKPVQNTSWLVHNSVNFEFTYSILLFPPPTNISLFKKFQCSASTGDSQFTNEQIFNVTFPFWCQNPVLNISLFSAKSAGLHLEKFLVSPTKSLNDTNMYHKFTIFCVHSSTKAELQFS